jgi:acyl-CoA synthetase (AMP-forming)/AMP-acid ligase II
MKVAWLLENQAKKNSNKPAIIFQGQTITFSQLRDICFKLADSLTSLGIKKGDNVAIYLPNWPEYIYSYLAIWSIGATAVPLDFMLTQEELVSCIIHSEATVLIAKSKPTVSLTNIKKQCLALKEIILCQDKVEGALSFEELLAKGENNPADADIPDKDYACIFYTSGSTGKPKGVLCNYLQLSAPAKAMAYFVDLNEKDIALCGALPFSHLGGLVFIQAIVFLGTTVVLMDRFIPLEFLRNIQNYKVTCFWLVPSMYYAILQLKEFESFDLSSLNWINCFGAPSSADQLRRFNKYCPQAEFFHGWGMTETQGPSIVTARGSTKIGSVGRAVPWMQVKILDENDKEVPQGKIGEIAVKSWVVTDGYYKDPQATALAFRNGWFHTGDLGRFDQEGYLYIAGRKKEMIKVGGEIVFEPEVELAIHKHPEVAEVAVIGVPDSLRGELPKAFVVLKEGSKVTEDGLRYFCREHLAHFKIPHYFEFMTLLPKNRAGKIDKEKLKATINK